MRSNLAKLSTKTMQVLTKVYIGFLKNGVPELVQELVDFHSDSVDPKMLTVSTMWIEGLLSEEPSRNALTPCWPCGCLSTPMTMIATRVVGLMWLLSSSMQTL